MSMRERGFTLLELLIALAIVSIGVLATLRALAMVTNGAADLRERRLAEWAAQNRLAELRALRHFPKVGASDTAITQGGRQFRLRLDVTATPNPRFRRVDIRVFAVDNAFGGTFGATSAQAHLADFVVEPAR